jgi:hypothetical protein
LQSPQHEDFVDASIRQFCASARARLQECADFDAKRDFLLSHIERVVFSRYKVMIVGSVPMQSASGETKLQFRVEGEIDAKAVRRSGSLRRAPILLTGTSQESIVDVNDGSRLGDRG